MSKVVQQCIKNRNGPAAGVHQMTERCDTTDASSADSAIDYNGTGLVSTAMSFMDSLLLWIPANWIQTHVQNYFLRFIYNLELFI